MTKMICNNEHGFTLVEMALSLTVIGLLLAGVLKGEELYQNAQIVSVSRQFTAYEAAIHAFRNGYEAVPGDMANPIDRLPDCTAVPCSTSGNGDGFISPTDDAVAGFGFALPPAVTEARNFWLHLAVAGLISGVDRTGASSGVVFKWGFEQPGSFIGDAGFAVASNTLTAPFPQKVTNVLGIIAKAGTLDAPLTTRQALNLDKKLDDAMPITGKYLADPDNRCYVTPATALTEYAIDDPTATCIVGMMF